MSAPGFGLVSRSRAVATPAELGQDCPPDPRDGEEPAPAHLRHRPELVELPDVQPFERCPHCEWSAPIGRIDPFAACQARVDADPIAARAESADADDSQSTLSGACVRADGGADQ